MLVIGGTTKVSVEVYDISAPENICDFKEPFERYAATGGIIDNQIVVCGGKSKQGGRHNDCSVISNEYEHRQLNMQYKRYGASSVTVNITSIWITGGNNGQNDLSSTEFITLNGSKVVSQVWFTPDLRVRYR